MTQACNLVSFKSATAKLSLAEIIPPIYILMVEGNVDSLGVEVRLVHRGVEDNYYVYEVVGCGEWTAGGVRPYHVAADRSQAEGIKGFRVIGADGQSKDVPF